MMIQHHHHQESHHQTRHILPHKWLRTIAIGLFASSGWILVVIMWSHSILEKHPTVSKSSSGVISPAQLQQLAQNNAQELLDDLWPDDFQHEGFFYSLHSCGYDDEGCEPENHPPKRVLLLHPPGSIGAMFVDFMKDMVFRHSHTNLEMEFVPTSHLPKDESSYSHIIRLATAPMLLAIGDGLFVSATPQEVTLDDVKEVAHILLNWHCQISELADTKSKPIMTISLQRICDDLTETHSDLRVFLSASEPSEDPSLEEVMEAESIANSLTPHIDLVRKVLKRVDDGLDKKKTGNLETIVSQIMDMHVDDGDCKMVELNHLEGKVSPRIKQLIEPGGTELDEKICKDSSNPLSTELACKEMDDPFTAGDVKKGGGAKKVKNGA